jgi:D-serine deaminase-like pyridoxal phosphate-dependent protein
VAGDDRSGLYARYTAALAGAPLPLAFVDLDAVDRNVDALTAPVRAAGKTLRVATKSLRCLELLRHVVARGGGAIRGVMAYSPREAVWLVERGFEDVIVGYPTTQAADVASVAQANRRGASVALVVDAPEHLALAGRAGEAAKTRVPVLVDVDVAYRPLVVGPHVGVRRSPLRKPVDVADFATRAARTPGVAFAGLLAYEAHVAGVADGPEGARIAAAAIDRLKEASRADVLERRAVVAKELSRRGLPIAIFNGGGTGSVAFSAMDPSLTEVTAGSGFVASHLFDHYRGLALTPAIGFALEITRRPAPGIVTCQGGGYVASGQAGADRLPKPWLPEGMTLLSLEGAGEVQTPIEVPSGARLSIGDPVFFRHAKAGELAERFAEYQLVRGERVERVVKTYRGEGVSFG